MMSAMYAPELYAGETLSTNTVLFTFLWQCIITLVLVNVLR